MAADELFTNIGLPLLVIGIPIISLLFIATEPRRSTSTSVENDLPLFIAA